MVMARWAFVGVICVLAGSLAFGQVGAGRRPAASLKDGVVARSKEAPAAVDRMLKALGPSVEEQLLAGRQVEIPGLGTLRVVRIEAYKDLDGGRPIMVPARNYVEFVPTGDLDAIANMPGAVPARSVPGYEFRVNPSSTPGFKTDTIKTIRTRR